MKKSLIETLLNEQPPGDYLEQEAAELRKENCFNESAAQEAQKSRIPPEIKLAGIMSGLIMGTMLLAYLLIF